MKQPATDVDAGAASIASTVTVAVLHRDKIVKAYLETIKPSY